MNLAGETAKSVCLGSAPLWVLGQRSPVHSTLFDFLVGTGYQGGPVLAQFYEKDQDKIEEYLNDILIEIQTRRPQKTDQNWNKLKEVIREISKL